MNEEFPFGIFRVDVYGACECCVFFSFVFILHLKSLICCAIVMFDGNVVRWSFRKANRMLLREFELDGVVFEFLFFLRCCLVVVVFFPFSDITACHVFFYYFPFRRIRLCDFFHIAECVCILLLLRSMFNARFVNFIFFLSAWILKNKKAFRTKFTREKERGKKLDSKRDYVAIFLVLLLPLYVLYTRLYIMLVWVYIYCLMHWRLLLLIFFFFLGDDEYNDNEDDDDIGVGSVFSFAMA